MLFFVSAHDCFNFLDGMHMHPGICDPGKMVDGADSGFGC